MRFCPYILPPLTIRVSYHVQARLERIQSGCFRASRANRSRLVALDPLRNNGNIKMLTKVSPLNASGPKLKEHMVGLPKADSSGEVSLTLEAARNFTNQRSRRDGNHYPITITERVSASAYGR